MNYCENNKCERMGHCKIYNADFTKILTELHEIHPGLTIDMESCPDLLINFENETITTTCGTLYLSEIKEAGESLGHGWDVVQELDIVELFENSMLSHGSWRDSIETAIQIRIDEMKK